MKPERILRRHKKYTREQGVALVMVLGLVALVAAWATTAVNEDWISLRHTENITEASRAWMAAESGIELAKLMLLEDANEGDNDHLEETWAQPTPPFEVDDGLVATEIIDSNRFFNLNDLVNDNGEVQGKAVAIAKRLFALADVSPDVVDAIVDWVDADDHPFGAGKEDVSYYGKPYHVKNARLDTWNELLLVLGIDVETLEKLRQVSIVRPVPSGGFTKINVNTASKEVLMALFPKLAVEDTAAIQRPYKNVDVLLKEPWLAGEANAEKLDVASDAFIVRSQAKFGHVIWNEESLLARGVEKVKILYRHRQEWRQ